MRAPSPVSALIAALALAACGREAPQPHERLVGGPRPTEHWLDDSDEEAGRLERGRWIEELHRTAPDVDWRAIERANGEREQARRNALGLAGGSKSFQSRWTEVGSSNLAGRMMVAALSPDRATLYSGSALGGLWRGNPDGSGWTPLGDNLFGGVTGLAVLPGEIPGDPEVVFVHTGGTSLRVTRDQGLTWEIPAGLSGINAFRSVGVLATIPPTLLVCAHVPGIGSQGVVLASTDYGRSFVQRWKSPTAGNTWMWVPRRGPGAASDVWLARKGEILRSTDGGWSFQSVGTADPGINDARLSGCEAGAPALYVMGNVSGTWKLYRSSNAGASFLQVHVPGDYWGAFCVSSVDPDLVMYGGLETHRSTDGGSSFSIINGWGQYYSDPANRLHADIMGISCEPDPSDPQGETWYICTDGGTYESRDGGQTVSNLSLLGLGVSQYYSTLTDSSDTNRIHAGSQDQGYQYGYLQPSTGSGPSTPFNQRVSGDYGHLTSTDGTHRVVYSTYPGFMLISENIAGGILHSTGFPATNHSWLPPVTADPFDRDAVFFCGDRLWRYTRSGNAWSPSQHTGFDFTAGGAAYLSALAFAPTDGFRAYAATNNGRLYWSTDYGFSWQASPSTGPSQHYFYGNALAVNPDDSLEAVVGGSGYSHAGMMRTTDGGQTWLPAAQGLPSTMVYDLAYSPDGSGDVFAATEAGAWRWSSASKTWSNVMSNEAPLTVYWSVEGVAPNIMRFGTYGRGIWDYEVYPTPDWSTYGTGKITSVGTLPVLSAFGTPTMAVNDFHITMVGAVPKKNGLLMISSSSDSKPFAGGTLLLGSPITRGPFYAIDNVGTTSVPMPVKLEWIGQQRFFQAWFRDPAHPDGTGIGLSNAMVVVFGP